MAIRTVKTKELTWYNIDDPNREVVDFLQEHFPFHPLDFKDVIGEAQFPKLDTYKSYLFIILHFPGLSNDRRQVTDNELDIFIGPDYLITIQKKRYKVLKDVFYRLLNNSRQRREYMSQGPGYLLYRLLEVLYRQSDSVVNNIGKRIRSAEKDVFEESKNMARALAEIRRHVLNFRAIIDPQRVVITQLAHINRSYMSKDLSVYYDDISDYLNKLWLISSSYYELIRGLHDTNESLISHRTNQVIKMLTVFSVALLPLTLLSGIYGMNIEGLPWAHRPEVVWLLYGGLLVFIIITIVYFRRKKWL